VRARAQGRLARAAIGALGWLVGLLLRLLRVSWRRRVEGAPAGGAALYAFWHGDQLALLGARAQAAVLVSRSRDGELAARADRAMVLSHGNLRRLDSALEAPPA